MIEINDYRAPTSVEADAMTIQRRTYYVDASHLDEPTILEVLQNFKADNLSKHQSDQT